jgi:hypothetical protein
MSKTLVENNILKFLTDEIGKDIIIYRYNNEEEIFLNIDKLALFFDDNGIKNYINSYKIELSVFVKYMLNIYSNEKYSQKNKNYLQLLNIFHFSVFFTPFAKMQ